MLKYVKCFKTCFIVIRLSAELFFSSLTFTCVLLEHRCATRHANFLLKQTLFSADQVFEMPVTLWVFPLLLLYQQLSIKPTEVL